MITYTTTGASMEGCLRQVQKFKEKVEAGT